MLTATQLAETLGVSRGRVSQYVAAGTLDGCFDGDGRARRFDLALCARALSKNLDRGQMLGNGGSTKRVLATLAQDGRANVEAAPKRSTPRSVLPPEDPDRYDMARAAKAEEDLRAMRLRNGREEGLYVLASEVQRNVSMLLAQEIAEMETVLRDGARAIADKMGVDFKATRQVLIAIWREHRAGRAQVLDTASANAELSEVEKSGNI